MYEIIRWRKHTMAERHVSMGQVPFLPNAGATRVGTPRILLGPASHPTDHLSHQVLETECCDESEHDELKTSHLSILAVGRFL